MHNESALLMRLHQQQLLPSSVLLINPPDNPAVYPRLNITGVLHDNFQNYRGWEQSGVPTWFACHLPDQLPDHPDDFCIILFLPKGKQRLLAQLQLLGGRVAPGTRLIVIGAIDNGIKSTGKKLDHYCLQVRKIDAARHCQAWSGLLDVRELTSLEDVTDSWSLQLNSAALDIAGLPGVFADGRLDSGSQLLLDTITANRGDIPATGSALDFGSGSGVLSAVLCRHFPKLEYTAVDNDAFAIQAARLTFQLNNITGTVSATGHPDDLSGQYQLIISNPPFHQGIAQTTAITQAFIQRLPALVAANGQTWLVANRFLNYEDDCQRCGLKVSRKAENNAYKVLLITR